MVSHGAPSASFSAGPSTGQHPLKVAVKIERDQPRRDPRRERDGVDLMVDYCATAVARWVLRRLALVCGRSTKMFQDGFCFYHTAGISIRPCRPSPTPRSYSGFRTNPARSPHAPESTPYVVRWNSSNKVKTGVWISGAARCPTTRSRTDYRRASLTA